MRSLSTSSRLLRWLPAAGIVRLTPTTALLGHDGWGDARLGNVDGTPVRLNDFVMIEELSSLSREKRHDQCRGASWCDCQHRQQTPQPPVTGRAGE